MTPAPDTVREVALDAIAAVVGRPLDDRDLATDVFDLGLDSLDLWVVLLDLELAIGTDVPTGLLDELTEGDPDISVARVLDAVAVWARTGADEGPPGAAP